MGAGKLDNVNSRAYIPSPAVVILIRSLIHLVYASVMNRALFRLDPAHQQTGAKQ